MLNPGDIVRLKEPYKPHDLAEMRLHNPQVLIQLGVSGEYSREQYQVYQEWKGFEYGIVAQILDRGRRCSLHLYTADGIMYRASRHTAIPCYVDFCADELTVIKRGSECGYEELRPEDQRALESEFRIEK